MAGKPESQRKAGDALDAFFDLGGEALQVALTPKLGKMGAALAVPAAQLLTSGGLRAAEQALGQPKEAEFTRQAYVPGTLPLTNEQAGYLYLDQMKYQNQLRLLQARENARTAANQPMSAATGMDTSATMAIDPMGAARAMYTTHQF
jgi:hypothetical protein